MTALSWREEMTNLLADAGVGTGYHGRPRDRRRFNRLVARMRVRGEQPSADEVRALIRAALGPQREMYVEPLVEQYELGA